MRVVIQRVKKASVRFEDSANSISSGMAILAGFGVGDKTEDVDYIANKITGLRIFDDKDGKMNLSLGDINGEVLVISQFTLFADCKKGKRPSFDSAAVPDKAVALYSHFIKKLNEKISVVKSGQFGADMEVELINEGPVTIILDSKNSV